MPTICSPFTENATPEERDVLVLFLMCEAFNGPYDHIELDLERYDQAFVITEKVLSDLDTLEEAFDMVVDDKDDRIRIQPSDTFVKAYNAAISDMK